MMQNTNSNAQNDIHLSELVRTKDDLVKTNQEVSLLEEALYHVDPQVFAKTLKEQVRESFASVLEAAFQKQADKKSVLEQVKKQLANFSICELKIAFEPSQASVDKIADWVRSNLGEGVIVDITFDPSVVAGAEISFNGKFVDKTLRKEISELKLT